MQYEQTMLQPAEIWTQPWKSRPRLAGRWPVKPSNEELRELVHLPRPERHVDVGELAEHLVLDGLRPAAADADHALGVAPLERRRLAEVGDEALVGLLADGAGVEQDEVGVLAAGRLGVPERLEHALHAFRVVLVHLAPEGGDVERVHRAFRSELVRVGNPGIVNERSQWRVTP
jgi:hypothetical protein